MANGLSQVANEFVQKRMLSKVGQIGGKTAYILFSNQYGSARKCIKYIYPAAINNFNDSMTDSEFSMYNPGALRDVLTQYPLNSKIFWAGMYNQRLYIMETSNDTYFIDYGNNRFEETYNGYRLFSLIKEIGSREDYAKMRVVVDDRNSDEQGIYIFNGCGKILNYIPNACIGSTFYRYIWCSWPGGVTKFIDMGTGKECSPAFKGRNYQFYRQKDTGNIIVRVELNMMGSKYQNILVTPNGMIQLTGYDNEVIGDKETPRRDAKLKELIGNYGNATAGGVPVQFLELNTSKWS